MSLDFFLGNDLTGYTSLNTRDEWILNRFHGIARRHTYATVYINTEGLSKKEANTRFTNLRKSVKDAHFSYIPVKKREIRNVPKEGEAEITYEDSMMIFAKDSLCSVDASDEKLLDFVVSLFKNHNDKDVTFLKERFVFKPKDAAISSLYDSAGKNLTKNVEILVEGLDYSSGFEEEIETEYFITAQPMCYSERHIRALKGEVFP